MTEPTGRDRRLRPRFNAALRCTLRLPPEDRDILFPHEQLACLTRDLSESGIGLVAPSIYLGYTCVVDEGRALSLSLELPGGPVVTLKTESAHYLRLDRSTPEATYLIGLRITEPAGEDLQRFTAYLSTLENSEQSGS
ncbi:MAG TPA: PilZ domain-containing protein [Pyrinomonadaceae bacterium]|nr:PilZ domain-containing protein [Pyrinomonadaceae bacterium]